MTETWKPVAGFEAEYEISDKGNLRSQDREIRNSYKSTRLIKGQMIFPYVRSDGYETVRIGKRGRKTSTYIHKLVAEAFLPAPNPGEEIRHEDGNKRNNKVENLSWGTRLDNMKDRKRLGESAVGENHGRSILTEFDVQCIRADQRMHKLIAADFGVSRELITQIKNFKIWKHV